MPTSVGTRRAPRKGKTGLGHLSLHLAPVCWMPQGLVLTVPRGYRVGMNEASHTSDQAAHPIDQRVRSLMDGRLDAARQLADAASEQSAAKAAFEDAQRKYVESFKLAEKAGWDRKELTTHLGFEEPGKAPRRRASSRRTTSDEATEGSNGGSASE